MLKLDLLITGEPAELPVWLGGPSPVECAGPRWGEGLARAAGPFAAVAVDGGKCYCAVDSVSSIPLFYAVHDGSALVSDDAVSIAERIGAAVSEPDAREFLETGFVTDERTLYQGVCSVLPGEVVAIDLETADVARSQYLDLEYRGESGYDEGGLVEGFDGILSEVFEFLAERLGGRTAVVPLSGGCDSRTVVAMLKRVGYADVLCFSYGRAGNAESEVSERVARGLGYRWEYVEYSGAMWGSLVGSMEYGRFLDYACRGKSIACLQPLPAMLELSRRGLLPEGAVVVPGHTLDVEMGSHLPFMKRDEEWDRVRYVEFIGQSHYNLGLRGSESERLAEYGERLPERMSRNEVMREVMSWEWRNRQARFIANDVRAYEFVGCGYELPFWDPRIVRFLSGVPYEGLYGRRLQYAFMRSVVDPLCGITQGYPEPSSPNGMKKVLKAALPMLARRYLDGRARAARGERVLADYDWMSRSEIEAFEALYGPWFNMNSFVADGTLQRVRARATSWHEG